MEKRFLILKFDDAKLYKTNKWTKDKIFDMLGSKRRDRFFIEPITRYQVSNVLHVLFNERPVPSRKACFYEKNEYYFNKALNSFIKYDRSYSQLNERGERIKHTQVRSLTSPLFNSWKKTVSANWKMLRILLGKENYDWFLDSLRNIFNIEPTNFTFNEVTKKLNGVMKKYNLDRSSESILAADGDNPEIAFFQELYNRNLASTLVYRFHDPKSSKITSTKDALLLTINNYIEVCEKYSGRIMVPINDDDYTFLKEKSKGVATILDGGFVWIEGVVDANFADLEGYIPVKDISTEEKIIILD